jgi:hypothetical protein
MVKLIEKEQYEIAMAFHSLKCAIMPCIDDDIALV